METMVSRFAMEFSELGWRTVRPVERVRRALDVLEKVAERYAVRPMEADKLERMTLAELLYVALAGDDAQA